MTVGKSPRRLRLKNRQTGMNAHAAPRERTSVLSTEYWRCSNVLEPRNGMSDKGEKCYPPYLRAWTQNGKIVYEEGRSNVNPGRWACIRQTKNKAMRRMSGKSQAYIGKTNGQMPMAFLSHCSIAIGTANRKSPVFKKFKDSECGTEEMAVQELN